MSDLVRTVLDAHGGLARWKERNSVTATLRQGGALWQLKGQGGVLDETRVTVSLIEEQASHEPFGIAGRRSHFTPARVAIEEENGQEESALDEPRASFVGHTLDTPWSPLQLAYFAGCAMWTYLNMPFLLAWPGVTSQEIAPWMENGETWRRLQVTLPSTIASHSTMQTLYVGADGLLRRHDYDVEIAGGTPGAHYIHDYVSVDGIMFPKRRRIYPRQPDGTAASEPLVVSIDLSDFAFG